MNGYESTNFDQKNAQNNSELHPDPVCRGLCSENALDSGISGTANCSGSKNKVGGDCAQDGVGATDCSGGDEITGSGGLKDSPHH